MKYLFVAALVAVLIWLVYRRLQPYIRVLRQLIQAFRGTLDVATRARPGAGEESEISSTKLVRCAACSTWVPANRAFHSHSSTYCSESCLRKAPKVRGRKTAS